MFACKKSKTHIVKDFLRFTHLQPYHRDQNGRNAVHYALENPDEQEASIIVKLLFEEYPLLVTPRPLRKIWATIPRVITSPFPSGRGRPHCWRFWSRRTSTPATNPSKVCIIWVRTGPSSRGSKGSQKPQKQGEDTANIESTFKCGLPGVIEKQRRANLHELRQG